MRKKDATLLLLMLFFSISVQGQEREKEDKKSAFPDVQQIRPSLPPQRYNREKQRWEKEDGPPLITVPVIT